MVGSKVWVVVLTGMLCGVMPGSRMSGQSVAVGVLVDSPPKATTVTLDIVNGELGGVLRMIASQAGLKMAFPSDGIPLSKRVTVRVRSVSAADAFAQALAGTGLRAKVVDDVVVIAGTASVLGAPVAQGVISGKVIDAKTRQSVRGATVSIHGTNKGITTRDDGSFRFPDVAPGNYTVQVRMLGYVKTTKSVTVFEGQTASVEIALMHSISALDQVVVTGTVAATELKAVPNAISVITAEDIERRGITRIDQFFRGDIPGLFAQNSGSQSKVGEVVMYSRGATAFSNYSYGVSTAALADGNVTFTNPIKTYVDGVELADSKFLSQIDPKSIERIEILTGPQASTVYGSEAINGVMQIFTKRGTTARPQLTLSLLSGLIQSNYSPAQTPQHDYSMQLNGVEGRVSYNAGGSWNYQGAWAPSRGSARTSAFGGTRLALPTPAGLVTGDATIRQSVTRTRISGWEVGVGDMAPGWYRPDYTWTAARIAPERYALRGQTVGLTLGYAPVRWWSHELVIGQDVSNVDRRATKPGNETVSDTMLLLRQENTVRRSIQYSTTVRVPVTAFAQATVTAGADGWQSEYQVGQVSAPSLSGSLTGTLGMTRNANHNAGGFLQTQLGVKDKLFFTYGLRAEWNPGFGSNASPNYAPRYGVAYTQDVGLVTAKVRASYGRSTRPPTPRYSDGLKASQWGTGFANDYVPWFGDYWAILPNPDLTAEYQQGGEGGLDLYLGTRASLTITRYNQTVDGLIDRVQGVDSVRTLGTEKGPNVLSTSRDEDGHYYAATYQYLNVGSIRNQGWELQGSVQTGPVTTRGTYSWTKSRTIGVDPKYRALLSSPSKFPQYQPGAMFKYVPEHTWAAGMTYAHAGSTVALNVTGTGRITTRSDAFSIKYISSFIRLPQNQVNMATTRWINHNDAYAMADLIVSQRFSPKAEGVLQVENLADRYVNDYIGDAAVMGRRFVIGLRLRP